MVVEVWEKFTRKIKMEINTKFDSDMGNKIQTMDLGELWEVGRSLDGDEEWIELKEMVKQGIDIKMDIRYIINKYYTEYPEKGLVDIKNYGRIDIRKFMDELEKRSDLLKNVLLGRVNQGRATSEGFSK
jgi:hypothetical protein